MREKQLSAGNWFVSNNSLVSFTGLFMEDQHILVLDTYKFWQILDNLRGTEGVQV
jgi:hypothetical protein